MLKTLDYFLMFSPYYYIIYMLWTPIRKKKINELDSDLSDTNKNIIRKTKISHTQAFQQVSENQICI